MTTACMSTKEAARSYISSGFMPVPVPKGSKRCILDNWPSLRIGADAIGEYFQDDGNIGILCGEPSGWLVDIDLDCPEAIQLAPQYLPATGAKSGRGERPESHWWYRAPGATTKKFCDPVTGKMILEYRSSGQQTLVGPSLHPSGDQYGALEGEPAEVEEAVLRACVERLYEAVTRARYPDGVPAGSKSMPRLHSRRRACTREQLVRRARAYIATMPAAVSGCGGHKATYAVATSLVHGFGLDPETALEIMMQDYNPRCDPPWTTKELQHKLRDADEDAHERPHGWLRDATTSAEVGPETEAIRVIEVENEPEEESYESCGADPGGFPAELLDVPGFIGEVMRYDLKTASSPQPVLALANAIALQGSLAARKVCDCRGNRTNVYCVAVAPSGSGKEHPRQVSKQLLMESGLARLLGPEEIASDAGLLTAVHAEPGSLFLIDEMGRFLKTAGSPKFSPYLFAVTTTFMKLFTSAGTVFTGKAYADDSKNKRVVQPCVSMFATSTHQTLFDGLTYEELGDGFLGRIVYFQVDEYVPIQAAPAMKLPRSITKRAEWWGRNRPADSAGVPSPRTVHTTPDAARVFDSLRHKARVMMRGADPFIASVCARMEEHACHLALIYACSVSHAKPQIDVQAATWATSLAMYSAQKLMFSVKTWVPASRFDAQQKFVIRVVRALGGKISRSALTRKLQTSPSHERESVILNLIETEQLKEYTVKSPTKRSTWYALPDYSWEDPSGGGK